MDREKEVTQDLGPEPWLLLARKQAERKNRNSHGIRSLSIRLAGSIRRAHLSRTDPKNAANTPQLVVSIRRGWITNEEVRGAGNLTRRSEPRADDTFQSLQDHRTPADFAAGPLLLTWLASCALRRCNRHFRGGTSHGRAVRPHSLLYPARTTPHIDAVVRHMQDTGCVSRYPVAESAGRSVAAKWTRAERGDLDTQTIVET
jgi:hypothetical protein